MPNTKRTTPTTIDLSYFNSNGPNYSVDVFRDGGFYGEAGYAVKAEGLDSDGDGVEDLVIGTPSLSQQRGGVYLFYGPLSKFFSGANYTSLSTADAFFVGNGIGDWAGYSVAGGDVDAHTGDEILVGATQRTSYRPGMVVIIPGSKTRYSGVIPLANVTMTTIYGEFNSDELGVSMAVGKIVSTRFNDMVFCGWGYPNGQYQGRCYVMPGSSNLPSTVYLNQTHTAIKTTITGINYGDGLGFDKGLALANLNGSGGAEIIITAPGAANVDGQVYIISPDSGLPPAIDLANYSSLVTFTGSNGDGAMGMSLSAGPDVNGDGLPDLLCGTSGNENSYLFYGQKSLPPTLSPNVTFYGGGDSVFIMNIQGKQYPTLFFANDNNGSGNDKVYAVPGGASLLPTQNLSTVSIITINGVGGGLETGFSLSAANQNLKDGAYPTLLLGTPFADPLSSGYSDGVVYAVSLTSSNFSRPTPTPPPTPTPVPTPAPVTINLANLSTNTGITMSLSAPRRASKRSTPTNLGYTVGIEDVTGDGIPDSVVAANTGEIFVLDGSKSPASTTNLRVDANTIISGIGGDTTNTVAVSDINRDGISDIAVGTPSTTPSKVIVFFGSRSLPKSINATVDANVTITPINPTDRIGTSVQITNGKLLTCAANANQCYVFNGAKRLPPILNAANAQIIQGPSGNNISVIRGGADVNGNGINDFIVADPNAKQGAGVAYLFEGNRLSSRPIVTFSGNPGDTAGSSLALGYVIGNDPYADVFIGAPGANGHAGIVYGFSGKQRMSSPITPNSANVQYMGIDSDDNLGTTITITDLDNSGRDDDLLMSADNANNGGGQLYGFLGNTGALRSGLTPSSVNVSTAPLVISGSGEAGFAVSTSNHNLQHRSILIGAPAFGNQAGQASEVFLPVEGLNPPAMPTPTPTPTPKKSDGGESGESRESHESNARKMPVRSPIMNTAAARTEQEEGWLSYGARSLSRASEYVASFWTSSDKAVVSDPQPKVRSRHEMKMLDDIQKEINRKLLMVGQDPSKKERVKNFQQQLDALRAQTGEIEPEALSKLQKSVKAPDVKVSREETSPLHSMGLFPAATSTTVPVLPTLAAQVNLTLSN